MTRDHVTYELSPQGKAKIEAVDGYLEKTIRDGDPIEALIATRMLGEITNARAKEAARVATEGSWSWSDVGKALGMSKQAAHEKHRARVRDEIAKAFSQVDEAEKAGHEKIARRAQRGRDGLEKVPPGSPKVHMAREQIDEWEERKHEKLDRKVSKAREKTSQAERAAEKKLDRKLN